jgi:hypothetical protein
MQLNKPRDPTAPAPKKNPLEQYIKRDAELKTEAKDRDSAVTKPKKELQKADIGAFVDKAKDVISNLKPALDYLLGYETTRFKQFLKASGGVKIEKLAAGRVPIEKAVRLGFDLLSGGKFEAAHKKLGVDNFFHLYLIINDKYVIEKNETVNYRPYTKNAKEERVDIAVNKDLTIDDMIKKAAAGDEKGFWLDYNPLGNNCQQWASRTLNRNGLMTAEAKQFINQDMKELLKELPGYVPDAGKALTDVASVLNRIVQLTTGGKLGFAVGNPDVGQSGQCLRRPKCRRRPNGLFR